MPDVDPGSPSLEDDDALRDRLRRLSHLSTSTLTLTQTLTQVAELTLRAIPAADGACLTLAGDAGTGAATSTTVREIADLETALREGPGTTAVLTSQTVTSGSLGGDDRWPRFGPRVGRLHVHSVLAVPLQVSGEVMGWMGLYARAKDAFDSRIVALCELFAHPAAISVHNARALADALELTRQLQRALTNRAVIDQSIGIMISRRGCTATEGFAKLRATSQSESRKLIEVAQSIVDDAARRARARRPGE